jgi:hypothetical protein
MKAAYQEYINLKDVLIEVEAKLAMEHDLATGINTLLDIISITL